jgi:hypothetical protein
MVTGPEEVTAMSRETGLSADGTSDEVSDAAEHAGPAVGDAAIDRDADRSRRSRLRIRSAAAILVLVVALALGAQLRHDSIRVKHGIHVDEAWSYVIATGHLGAFVRPAATASLRGHWVPASQWKKLWLSEQPWALATVSSDLAHFDVHPPLYFWVLHLWILVFGVHISTGPNLNLVIALFTGLALFGLARRLLRDPLAAAFVTLIWSVSQVPRASSSMARMYDLEALFAVLFVWLLVLSCDPERKRGKTLLVLLALAAAGGMLVQYQFALVLVGGGLYACYKLWRCDRGRLVRLAASVVAGVLVMAVVQPGVYHQLLRQSGRHVPFSKGVLVSKINSIVNMQFNYFAVKGPGISKFLSGPVHAWGTINGHRLSSFSLLVFWLALLAVVVLALPWTRRPLFRWLRRVDKTGWAALFFFVWIAGTIVLQNLSFRVPPTVESPRYLAVAWPFLAFLPVLVLRSISPRWYLAAVAVFCFAYLVPASRAPVNYVSSSGSLAQLRTAKRVVFDSPLPGVLPVAMWQVPDDALVWVDTSSRIEAANSRIMAGLDSGGYYVLRSHRKTPPDLPPRATYIPPRQTGLQVYRIAPASGATGTTAGQQ